jgi:tetratricopeptide (TPR) repeat protein
MPAGLYWMGECLYSLGQLEAAQEFFLSIMNEFPYSVKYEAASYRVALISQKKIEAELLSILKWTHEESLKTVEEYQRRERSYDQAIIAYQKRIADMLKESRLADLETANTDYQRRLVEAEARIVFLETRLRDSNIGVPGSNATDMVGSSPAGGGSSRILSIRNSAQDVVNELLSAEAGSSRASNGGDGR